eukprot:3768912-Amphidinium_carterae.1
MELWHGGSDGSRCTSYSSRDDLVCVCVCVCVCVLCAQLIAKQAHGQSLLAAEECLPHGNPANHLINSRARIGVKNGHSLKGKKRNRVNFRIHVFGMD